ncbi:hypothetical protein GPK87_04375 [Oscillibacter sp. MCC667]|nr:hypothetical protein [Oscillibacter sp. MCC667]
MPITAKSWQWKQTKTTCISSSDTTRWISVCNIVKTLKQETTHHLWQRFGPFLAKHHWKKRIFWSNGYFACSIGEVSSAIIQKYIENQG